MGLVAWMVYFLKVIARLLSLVLVLSFGFASLAKHAAVTKVSYLY